MRERLLHPLLDRAMELASRWHEGTYRKVAWRPMPEGASAGVPVLAHTAMVGLILQRAGWDEVTVAAGLLHDVLEDPNREGRRMSYEELAAFIGAPVASLVRWVSEPRPATTAEPLKPWHARKAAYLQQLSRAPDEALAISLADKLHNLASMVEALEAGIPLFESSSSFSVGPEEQIWFIQEVLRLAAAREHPALVPLREELSFLLHRFQALTAR